MEALASLGQELRDREDLRMDLLRLEVRKGQQWTGGGPGEPALKKNSEPMLSN
jgi:hypothetical protein